MQHGRDHDERQQKANHPRRTNLPDDEDTRLEAELLSSGRGGVRPHDGVIGPQQERLPRRTEEAEVAGPEGSEYAPTLLATERERERHRLERAIGRIAAGTVGEDHDRRTPHVTREALEGVAREADRRVVGREVGRAGAKGTPGGEPKRRR